MMNVITALDRNLTSTEGMKSYNLFSYGDYFDPANMNFGPLKVFNDEQILPKAHFPQSTHSEVEIITIQLDGKLVYTNSLGDDKVTLGKGVVQRVTAGQGISLHMHNDTDDEVHQLHLRFEPNTRGLVPSFEHKDIDFFDASNELIPLATGQKVLEDVVFMNSNSTIYYGALGKDKDIGFNTFKIRKALFYVLEGELFVNGVQVGKNDQLRIADQDFLKIQASADASFIMVDVPAVEANY